MWVGKLVAIKYKDEGGKSHVSEAVLVNRTISDSGLERWHALVDGHVVQVEPWQIGPVEVAVAYRRRKLKLKDV